MLEWFFFNWLTGGGEQSKEQVKVIQEGEIGLLRKEKYFVRKKTFARVQKQILIRFVGSLAQKEKKQERRRNARLAPFQQLARKGVIEGAIKPNYVQSPCEKEANLPPWIYPIFPSNLGRYYPSPPLLPSFPPIFIPINMSQVQNQITNKKRIKRAENNMIENLNNKIHPISPTTLFAATKERKRM